jgi:hypothetical protein
MRRMHEHDQGNFSADEQVPARLSVRDRRQSGRVVHGDIELIEKLG